MLVSRLLRLLGLLQLLEAPEDSLTTGGFSWDVVEGMLAHEVRQTTLLSTGQQPGEWSGASLLYLGTDTWISYSEKDASLLEAPAAF